MNPRRPAQAPLRAHLSDAPPARDASLKLGPKAHVFPSTIGEEATCARLGIPKEEEEVQEEQEGNRTDPCLARDSPARGQCAASASMGDRPGLQGQEARRIPQEHRAAAAQGEARSHLSSKAARCKADQRPAQLSEGEVRHLARGLRRHAGATGRCLRRLQEQEKAIRAALRRPLSRDRQGARAALQELQLRARTFPRRCRRESWRLREST